jgi:outer membrane lipoprotein-sorting protein
VKTWIDPKRMVPLKIEKYDSAGKVVRRITITRILLDGGDSLPADLEVSGSGGSVTHIHGSGLKRGQNFPESDFTTNGLKQLSTPPE